MPRHKFKHQIWPLIIVAFIALICASAAAWLLHELKG